MKKLSLDSLKTIYGGTAAGDPPPFGVFGGSSGGSCFAEDTKLTTKSGQKMIKDLDPLNDEIWNPMNQQWMKVARKTISIYKKNALTIVTTRGTVTVTDNHAFMLQNGDLVKAGELNAGDMLADGRSGDFIKEVNIVETEDYMTVYNLVFENDKNLNNVPTENHFVEANGVVSGLLYLQDEIAHKVRVFENVYA